LILNLDGADIGEFAGHSALDHLHAIQKMAPELTFHYVVADQSSVEDSAIAEELSLKVSTQGGELLVADLRSDRSRIHHDPKKLALRFSHIVGKTLVG
jgi:hypothetical protein